MSTLENKIMDIHEFHTLVVVAKRGRYLHILGSFKPGITSVGDSFKEEDYTWELEV